MADAAEIFEWPATITDRGQTTVPAAIRKMLGLGKRDQVVFRGLADGTVMIARRGPPPSEDDPVIGRFLAFLSEDMERKPSRIRPIRHDMIARGRALVEGVDVDLDAALPNDDA